MARALVVKCNVFLEDKEMDEIRQDVLRQYDNGGVIILPKSYDVIEVDFDRVIVKEDDYECGGKRAYS